MTEVFFFPPRTPSTLSGRGRCQTEPLVNPGNYFSQLIRRGVPQHKSSLSKLEQIGWVKTECLLNRPSSVNLAQDRLHLCTSTMMASQCGYLSSEHRAVGRIKRLICLCNWLSKIKVEEKVDFHWKNTNTNPTSLGNIVRSSTWWMDNFIKILLL